MNTISNTDFLEDGGEMGERIKAFDWSETSLGAPEMWPKCLQLTISLILNTDFPMFLYWGEDCTCFYNDAYRPNMGDDGKHPYALGQAGKDVFPEVWPTLYPMIQRIQNGEKSFRVEDGLIPIFRNGRLQDAWWTYSFSQVKNDSGGAGGVLIIITETTEKIKSLRKLEASRHQFENLISDTTIGISVLTGEELTVEIANNAFCLLLNQTPEQLTGKPLFNVVPELQSQFGAVIKKVRQTAEPLKLLGHPYYVGSDEKRKEGFLNLVFQPYKVEGGTITGVMIVLNDATEQALARKKTEESEQNLRNIILQAPVAMCIFRGHLHITDIANEKMIELWGRPEHDVLNKPIFEGLPEAKNQGFEELLNNVYNSGESFAAYGLPITLPRDETIETVYLNFVYTPLREDNGAVTGVMAVASDVTQQVIARREIEAVVAERTKELKSANTKLLKSNRELEEFAYIASHDLQEPLRKISNYSDRLKNIFKNETGDSLQYLNRLSNAAERMRLLINDLLSLSQLGRRDDVYELMDLNNVVTEATENYELLIAEKQAKVIAENLPVIEGIPLQLKQLFSNLIGNSLKFTNPGHAPLVEITSSALASEEAGLNSELNVHFSYVKVEIKDNGIGFPNEYSEKIFSIFQRLHDRQSYSGTGIGLALCKKIVANHRGSISAISEEDKGSTFTVILPVRQMEGSVG